MEKEENSENTKVFGGLYSREYTDTSREMQFVKLGVILIFKFSSRIVINVKIKGTLSLYVVTANPVQ
jgi:hypothetical protein